MFELLRCLILDGEYVPDEERLAVSRMPVRQALTMLEAEGLVEILPNRGTVVCSFGLRKGHIYDLRAVLEGHAARRAAGQIDGRELGWIPIVARKTA